MKIFLLLVLVGVALAAEHYTTKYDSIDIDAILANPRLLTYYMKCLLEKGPCNEEGKVLKSVLSDALITDCKKCSSIQRVSVRKVIKFLIKNRPADWKAMIAKYDPTGKYWQAYKHYLDK